MDFARQQRDPTKHVIGIVFVVLIHVLVIYALLTGLARTVVEVIKKPLSATIVDEIKAPPPPPPPPKRIVETPKVQAPVETYVPPPDIPVPTTQTAPVITAVTPTPPTEPHVIAPPVVAPPAPPAPPPKPAIRKNPTRASGDDLVYPRAAIRAGVAKGRVTARVMIDEKGNVTDVIITSSDPPRVFDRVVIDGVKEWKYTAEGEKYVAEIEVIFRVEGIAERRTRNARTAALGRPSSAPARARRQSSRKAIAAAAQVAAPSATTPVPIPTRETRCPTISRTMSCAKSMTVPGSASAIPIPATAQSAVSAGLRHAGSAAGTGSAAITRAVNPASSR